MTGTKRGNVTETNGNNHLQSFTFIYNHNVHKHIQSYAIIYNQSYCIHSHTFWFNLIQYQTRVAQLVEQSNNIRAGSNPATGVHSTFLSSFIKFFTYKIADYLLFSIYYLYAE